MARVPTYDNLQTRVEPGSQPSVNSPNALQVAGEQLQQAGAAGFQASSEISKFMLEAQHQADQVRVSDAMNQAVSARLKLTHDKDSGFTMLEGRAALDRPDGKPLDEEYGGKLSGIISQISGGLGSERQRREFGMQSGQLEAQFRGQIQAHMAKEGKQFSLSTQVGTMKIAADQIALEPTNPASVAQGIEAIKQSVAELGRLKGLSPEETAAQTVEAVSTAHNSVVAGALQSGSVTYAQDYLNKFSAEMTPAGRLHAVDAVRAGHASVFERAGVDALTNSDAPALGAMVEKIKGPDGDVLGPVKRAQITHQLFGWQQHILSRQDRAENQAEAEQQRRENGAIDVYNKGLDLALGGGYLSPDFIKTITEDSAGTKMAAPVLALIASQRGVAGFASRPAAERAVIIERMRSSSATPGIGTDPSEAKLVSAMTIMDSKLKASAADNPWAAAQTAGVIQDAPQFDVTKPAGVAEVIRQRTALIGKVEEWTGSKVSPLQPQEVEKISAMVRQMPVDQASSMLAEMGGAVGDAGRVAMLGKQMHDKDGALGLAMMYANNKTTEGRYTAELVLRGDQALKDNTALVDKAGGTGWKATIAKELRGAYSNREMEGHLIDAAFKIAAANFTKDGSPDIERAINLATGGGIVERNGSRVPLPAGMSEKDFGRRIESITTGDLAAQVPGYVVYAGRTPIPLAQFVDSLPKAALVHAGQGLYSVRAGASLATDPAGKPIVLRVAP